MDGRLFVAVMASDLHTTGNAQAIVRCGEPMQLQLRVRIFAQITPNGALLRAHARLTECAMMKECR